MRVLYITNMYPSEENPYYGIFVKEQIESLQHSFNIDFEVYYIKGMESPLNYYLSIQEIRRVIRMKKFDLIHIHYGLSGLFLLSSFNPKIPVVLTLHGGDILKEQGKWMQIYLTKRILKKVNLIITLNEKMDLIARTYGLICRIPCAVNTSLFYPSDTSNDKNSDANTPRTIIFPSSRDRSVKNYPLFASVLDILNNKYNIQTREIDLENMSRAAVRENFQQAHLLLLTSISEGSPQVVKEAMACNLPVVSTRVGDVANLLSGVEGSAVCESFSAEALAQQAYLSLTNQIKGKKGRDRIIELGLDDVSTSQRIYEEYNRLVSNK